MTNQLPQNSQLCFIFSPQLKKLSIVLMVLGLLIILLQILFPWHMPSHVEHTDGVEETHHVNPRLFYSIHLALLVAIPLSLGGIYFTSLNHISGAAWSVSVRRLAEHLVWYLPVAFILMAILLFAGMGDVFHHWVQAPKDDHLIAWKAPWLNVNGFVVRNIASVLIWFFFGYLLWKKSIQQDKDGSLGQTRHLAKLSAGFLVLFAITYSVHSWDLSLSLEPHWFSTLWAIYVFSGFVLTVFASLILWVWYLKRNGYYGAALNENHLHDLGKYLWGHSIFWAYIAVSQYMLIWYAAIPEETIFFKTRSEKEWLYVSYGLAMLRFVLPFLLLLKREWKRKFNYMAAMAVLVLMGQIWDIYWIAYPVLANGEFVWLSWQELGPLSFVAGSYIFVIASCLKRYSLIPEKDPRLEKCLNFHQ